MQLPKSFLPYEDEAELLSVTDFEFAGPTYQMQVNDAWAFLQLNPENELQDSFCSCDEEDENGACIHQAVAWKKIFSIDNEPLHLHFERSLWNAVFQLVHEKYGEDLSPIKGAAVQKLLDEWEEPTKDTSLILSGLNDDEVDEWLEGSGSDLLNYQLSFLGDLAKQFFRWELEAVSYSIHFGFNEELFPNFIHIAFPSVELKMPLTPRQVMRLVPTLNTVKAPLTVTDQPIVEKFQYDPDTAKMHVSYRVQKKDLQEGVLLDGWHYKPKVGFRRIREEEEVLTQEDIAHFLDRNVETKKTYPVSYHMHFDQKWRLHIAPYVLTPGDLKHEHFRHFGNWVYLDQHGFLLTIPGEFGLDEMVISETSVDAFVTTHKQFLNEYSEFKIHLTALETALSYELTAQAELHFLPVDERHVKKRHIFGNWTYIYGEGFFPTAGKTALFPGLKIPSPQISYFINEQKDDLTQLHGFFAKRSPVLGAKLTLQATKDRQAIHIDPSYILEDKAVELFGDYTYVQGEGFAKIPPQQRLPTRYTYPVEIPLSKLPEFLEEERELIDRIGVCQDPIDYPKDLQLVATEYSEQEGVFQTQFQYKNADGAIDAYEIAKAVHKNQKLLLSLIGLVDLKEPHFQWLRRIDISSWDPKSHTLTLNLLDLLRLQVVYECSFPEGENPVHSLLSRPVSEKPNPKGLLSVLRPYQKIGLEFLYSLWRYGLSGLLCDEMGLGKTHQAMALIASVHNTKPGKYLIVCPTTVIYHWEEKIKQYFPMMKVLCYHGTERSIEGFLDQYDLLITSYGVWRRDFSFLNQFSFEVAVFDEIHSAKNQSTRLHASLVQVNAKMKVGLTGTPIENNLYELKAIFDLILPGLMPHSQDYKKQIVDPIEKIGDPKAQEKLNKLTAPFLLRRTKKQVLTDLPEKSEEIAHCTLYESQRILYKELIEQRRESLIQQLQNRDISVPYMHIFALFSSLKQVCNHPAAYLKQQKEYKSYQSGKWELFCELLSEALSSGQKVVVFTQYLAMLDIMELYALENKISFATIRGSTLDRGDQVKKFNEDPSCKLFLGSLGAAGTGIDLTSGSVVIHYDRWWNQAKESQATDRVHRIGQTRGVQVFKLMTMETIEERIDQLIRRKGKLMEEVIGIDDQALLKTFTRDDLIELLSELEDFED